MLQECQPANPLNEHSSKETLPTIHNSFTHGRQLLAFSNLDANSKEVLTSIQQLKPLSSRDDLDPYVRSH